MTFEKKGDEDEEPLVFKTENYDNMTRSIYVEEVEFVLAKDEIIHSFTLFYTTNTQSSQNFQINTSKRNFIFLP